MIRHFVHDDGGAVAVDWIVLTAASVGLGLAVMNVVSGAVEDAANDLAGFMTSIEIRTTFAEWETFRDAQTAAVVDPDSGVDDPDPDG